ncbi:hypothetical protein ACNTMW_00630 [Planosporangium sp. 12N6]|uniref:hypothetical protein n=1 Tax=Planosporangium spinosum TaxID=3402278 RepID=UPI003CE875B9
MSPVGAVAERETAGREAADGGRSLARRATGVLSGAMHRMSGLRVTVPLVGEVRLPPAQEFVFYATVGVLAATRLVPWPVAFIVVIGHVLATRARSRMARDFGEGLQQA